MDFFNILFFLGAIIVLILTFIFSRFDLISFLFGWFLDKLVKEIPLPKDTQEKIQYFFYEISKVIRYGDINIMYSLKTNDLEKTPDELMLLRDLFVNRGYIFKAERGDSLIFEKKTGSITPSIIIQPTMIQNEDGELYISTIEVQIELNNSKYYKFTNHIMGIILLRNDLQIILLEKYGELRIEALTCKLPKPNRLAGLFQDFKLTNLRGQIMDKPIIFGINEITFIGKLNQDLIEIIKKVITFYY